MKLKPLGRTNLYVSPMGIGLAALGRPGYINIGHAEDLNHDHRVESMQARTHEILDLAYARGIRYFDAARSYGRSEEFLGAWLSESKAARKGVVVGSKWGYTYTADWTTHAKVHEVKEHSRETLEKQWTESRSCLGSRPDLYQIHSATVESRVLENRDVLTRLVDLKNKGVVIGLTTSGHNQKTIIEQASQLKIDGIRLFDCVQATWNLLETSAGSSLLEAGRRGLGIIIKEGLANGRLTEKNRIPDFANRLKILKQEADRLETGVDALALAAIIKQPWVDVVLSGASTRRQLESNLKALEIKPDQAALDRLKTLIEPPGMYWKTRSGLEWN